MNVVRITPTSVDGVPAEDPLYEAIENGEAGSTVEMEDGAYKAPHYFTQTNASLVRAIGDNVRIEAGAGATLFFTQPWSCRDITFDGITIEAGLAAVLTDGKTAEEETDPNHRYYERVNFLNCDIDGGFNHATKTGRGSKWGMRLHQWTGSVIQNCHFHNIKWEHGLYYTQGGVLDTLIDQCTFDECGRAGIQEANRHEENDGLQAEGELRVRNCSFRRLGLMDGAGAITISGRRGLIWLEKNSVWCTEDGNALVIWGEYDPVDPDYPKQGTPNYGLVVSDLDVIGNDCVRPLIQIAATDHVRLLKGNVTGGANPTSIWMNGSKYGMGGRAFRIKDIELSLTGFRYAGRWVDEQTQMKLLP